MRCDAFARYFVLVPSALVLSAAPAALAAAGPAVEGVLLGHLVSDSVGLWRFMRSSAAAVEFGGVWVWDRSDASIEFRVNIE